MTCSRLCGANSHETLNSNHFVPVCSLDYASNSVINWGDLGKDLILP